MQSLSISLPGQFISPRCTTISRHTLHVLSHFPVHISMAASAGASIALQPRPRLLRQTLATTSISSLKSLSFSNHRGRLSSQRLSLRLRVSCAAKPETVEKVCDIVRKQLALPEGSAINGESKFAALGADSLDTVEIVMGLEEAFGISVEEDSAQSILTVQDAAELIEQLVAKKDA